MHCVVVLHNIRSVHNTGSIFRTADGAGVSRIILAGYTPAPVDERGNERNDFKKVALGAEKSVPWERSKQLASALKRLKKEGYRIVAVELDKGATPLFKYKSKGKIAIVLGNEVDGLSKQALALCDDIVEIPMRGMKESLNVSVSAGIALYTLLRS